MVDPQRFTRPRDPHSIWPVAGVRSSRKNKKKEVADRAAEPSVPSDDTEYPMVIADAGDCSFDVLRSKRGWPEATRCISYGT